VDLDVVDGLVNQAKLEAKISLREDLREQGAKDYAIWIARAEANAPGAPRSITKPQRWQDNESMKDGAKANDPKESVGLKAIDCEKMWKRTSGREEAEEEFDSRMQGIPNKDQGTDAMIMGD
ncbi:unnamed protein product, partial [Prorocentrum cordatum]